MVKTFSKLVLGTLISLTLIILYTNNTYSQIDIDSLKLALSKSKGEEKAVLYLELSNQYRIVSQDMSMDYAHSALKTAKKYNNDSLIALCYKTIGVNHYFYAQTDSAIYYNLFALDAYKALYDSVGLAKAFNNLGIFYSNIGLYSKAIEYHLQSLSIKEHLADSGGISRSYNNIGTLYYEFGNFELALDYFSRSHDLAKKLNSPTSYQSALSNLGLIYIEYRKYDEALKVLNLALEINNRNNDVHSISRNLMNIGKVHYDQGKFEKALEFYLRTLDLNSSYSIKNPGTFNSLGQVYDTLGNREQALFYFAKGHELAIEIDDKSNQMMTSQNLALMYRFFGQHDLAWQYLNESHRLHDSLTSEMYSKQIGELDVRRSMEKRQEQLSQLESGNKTWAGNNLLFGTISYKWVALLLAVAFLVLLVLLLTRKRKEEPVSIIEKQPQNNPLATHNLAMMQEMINRSADLMCLCDGNDKILEVNEAFKSRFDLDDSIIGKETGTLPSINPFYETVLNECQAMHAEVWKSKRPVRQMLKIKSPNGPEKELEIEKTPLFNKDGSRQGIITIGNETSEPQNNTQALEDWESNETPPPSLLLEHENPYETIVSKFFDAIFYLNRDGIVQNYVINSTEVASEETSDLTGKQIGEEVLPKPILDQLIEELAEVFENDNEKYYNFKPNTNIALEFEGFLRKLSNDQALLIIRKKQAVQAKDVVTSIDEYERIFLSSPSPNYLIDKKLNILKTNAAGKSLLYIKADKPIHELNLSLFMAQNTAVKNFYEYLDSNQFEQLIRIQLKNSEGKTFTAELQVCRINYLSHNDAFFVTAHDISPILKLEEDLVAANQLASETTAQKSAFLANMSHEIRTPMNSIIGFSKLLLEESISDDQKVLYVRNINDSGNSLLKFIDDVIDLSKIESGQITINQEACNLKEAFSEFYIIFTDHFKAELDNIEFKIRLGSRDDDFAIYTDVLRFTQIMSNFISNAFKYTSKGIIEIGYNMPEGSEIEFYVKDTGIGISKDKQERIFNHFNEVNESATRMFGGAGLGLMITKSLISKMGGRIYVESEEKVGSTFHFTLPYLPVVPEDFNNAGFDMPTERSYNFKGKTLLIAEDVEPNYQLIKSYLRKTKADLIWAKDGKEAVELCKKQKMDAIVMDIQMPVLNGFEAMHAIKKTEPDLPIIAQTAYAMVDDRKKILDEGFDEYISKPLRVSDFLSILDRFLNP